MLWGYLTNTMDTMTIIFMAVVTVMISMARDLSVATQKLEQLEQSIKANEKVASLERERERDARGQAQLALSMLKSSVYNLLKNTPTVAGLRNVDIARQLGIRGGIGPHHDIRHRDWISKTILCIMEREEVAEQIGTRWFLKAS